MFYILLPVHNRAETTREFVEAIARQDCEDFQLVLIDDGCIDDTVAIVRAALPASHLVVLRGEGNLWWAGALQVGYKWLERHAKNHDDFVLLVNDDTCPSPSFLSNARRQLLERPSTAIQAMGIDRITGAADRGTIVDPIRLTVRAANEAELPNCLATRGLVLGVGDFMRSGGFRPRWLPHYLSDYEFSIRLRRQGVALACDSGLKLETRSELTGNSKYDISCGPRNMIKAALSNRAKYNPLHWSVFIVLVCPWWVVPLHLARTWLGFGYNLVKSVVRVARNRIA